VSRRLTSPQVEFLATYRTIKIVMIVGPGTYHDRWAWHLSGTYLHAFREPMERQLFAK